MVEIVNNQRKYKLEWETFRTFAETAVEEISEAEQKNFTVAFISDRRMRELNKTFREKNSTTDVLSFPFDPNEFELGEETLGEIVISIEQAEKQAAENDLTLASEIKQLILHGILHLCGYDHETDAGEMNRRELKLREILAI